MLSKSAMPEGIALFLFLLSVFFVLTGNFVVLLEDELCARVLFVLVVEADKVSVTLTVALYLHGAQQIL